MVAKRIDEDDVPDLRPRPSGWRYLAYTVLGGAAAALAILLIAAIGSDERAPGWLSIVMLGFLFLALYGLMGMIVTLISKRSAD